MKKKYLIITILSVFAALVFTGCNINREKTVEDAKDNVKEANQDLKDAQAEYEKEWQQFRNDAELKISANEKSIFDLKAEIKTASRKFKVQYESEVALLEQKNVELKKSIIEYKYEGKDKWEEFKEGFNRNLDIVEKAIKDMIENKELTGS